MLQFLCKRNSLIEELALISGVFLRMMSSISGYTATIPPD